jgi:hypothetical protein
VTLCVSLMSFVLEPCTCLLCRRRWGNSIATKQAFGKLKPVKTAKAPKKVASGMGGIPAVSMGETERTKCTAALAATRAAWEALDDTVRIACSWPDALGGVMLHNPRVRDALASLLAEVRPVAAAPSIAPLIRFVYRVTSSSGF